MAGFWNQAVALSRKNLTYHRRHLQSNLRVVLFPAILFVLLGGLRHYQLKKDNSKPGEAKMPTERTPLLLIPAAEFRAVKTEIMYLDDLPDQSCRVNGSCPASILVTGNNRSFGLSVAGNMFSHSSYSPNNTEDAVFGMVDQTAGKKYYYLQSQCTSNSTIPVRTQQGKEEAQCVRGLRLWRTNYVEINDELFKGHYSGNDKGEINEILAAYDFRDSSMKNFDVHMWYNTTPGSSERTSDQLPVGSALNMVWNAYLQSVFGPAIRMIFEFIGEMPTPSPLERTDLASEFGAFFFTWMILQLFPVILSSLVYEKQQKLTTMMKMHGLGHAPYWD